MLAVVLTLISTISFTKSLNLTCKSVGMTNARQTDLYPMDVCFSWVSTQTGTTSSKYYCSSTNQPMLATYPNIDCSGDPSTDYALSALYPAFTMDNGCLDPDLPQCDYLIRRHYTATECDNATNTYKYYQDVLFTANTCVTTNSPTGIVSLEYACSSGVPTSYTLWNTSDCTGKVLVTIDYTSLSPASCEPINSIGVECGTASSPIDREDTTDIPINPSTTDDTGLETTDAYSSTEQLQSTDTPMYLSSTDNDGDILQLQNAIM